MAEIILQNKAQEALDYIGKYHKYDFEDIVSSLKEFEREGWNWSKIKNIGNGVKRLRIGRWRVLCTFDGNIYVRIIAIEKDTRKDYERWKKYILSQM